MYIYIYMCYIYIYIYIGIHTQRIRSRHVEARPSITYRGFGLLEAWNSDVKLIDESMSMRSTCKIELEHQIPPCSHAGTPGTHNLA